MGHPSFFFAVAVNLRPTVSRPVCPGVRRPSGTHDQFFFLLEISFRRALGFTQSLTEMRIRNVKIIMFLGSKVRPVRRADNLTAI
jgi:hypothetical protein